MINPGRLEDEVSRYVSEEEGDSNVVHNRVRLSSNPPARGAGNMFSRRVVLVKKAYSVECASSHPTLCRSAVIGRADGTGCDPAFHQSFDFLEQVYRVGFVRVCCQIHVSSRFCMEGRVYLSSNEKSKNNENRNKRIKEILPQVSGYD